MVRRVFYSYHHQPDHWRAAIVRGIGAIDGSKAASDNDWATVVSVGEEAIRQWIDEQMSGRSCAIVLVGAQTANRKWINYEIVSAWNRGMGVVGFCVHGLQDQNRNACNQGANPFDFIRYGDTGRMLSSIVKCYNPVGATSKERYDWIVRYLGDAIEEAIGIRTRS